ncbi:MAG: sugar ABC transporter ATP-binding protein [Verrucomicrobia bacterium]|nr:sugar ABC transporter ATP-binding protein [Verrucomicrobiota bacterium]
MSEPILSCRGLTKRFPGVVALDGVDFFARPGEVHALMGENGAGKSTLIKALTGVHPRDAGEAVLAGKSIHPRSPREAEAAGISTVYQEVNLIPDLSVAENICLGRQETTLGFIRWGAIRERASAALARLGVAVDVDKTLSDCSIAIQQLVAIARATDISARVLILDEPTSSLDDSEVEELFTVVRRLRDEGWAIIFVSHFLDQVYALADRITVLRNGKLVGEFLAAELPRLQLVAHMMGRSINEVEALQHREPPARPAGEPLVSVRGFGRRASVRPLDLEVRRGEVLGLAGLLGSGRTEVARLLFGLDRADSGEMHVEGKPAAMRSPQASLRARFALTPEDRKSQAILPNLTVRENLIIALQARRGIWRKIPRQEQDRLVSQFTRALGIKTSSPEQLIRNLSGGNQQKVILARWLATEPRLLLLDEPTRGIDVGAQADIERLLAKLRDEGLAIIFICADTAELARNSQRIAVMRDRAKVAELTGADLNEQAIMRAIAHGDASHPSS